jgi:SAM-dependent methyltransferase
MKLFTTEEIDNIYSKVKKDDKYFKKYEVIPECPVNSCNYSWYNFDVPRVWCLLDFKEWIEKYNITNIEHLGYTTDSDPELDFITPKNKTLISYPPYDLHTVADKFNNTFDFFLFNQTLEHLYNPFLSVENIYEIVKPGGYVFTSVPTINIPHLQPFHFNGFTPMGLATLFLSAGFELIEIGQWGNYDYIQQIWGDQSWKGVRHLIKDGKISNEELNVCQCWILVRKSTL